MKTVRLVTCEDGEGFTGLMIKGTPVINYPMVATEGLLIAHDLLEHVNGIKSIGSVDDELEAVGGVWFVRGHMGQLRRDGIGNMYSPEENLAGDIVNLGTLFCNGVDFRTPIPKTRAGAYDDALQTIVEIGTKELKSALSNYDDYDTQRYHYYTENIMHYLRAGFRKAKRKYKEPWIANNMFWTVADAVEPYVSQTEFIGQEFILRYDKNNAYCEEYYGDEY